MCATCSLLGRRFLASCLSRFVLFQSSKQGILGTVLILFEKEERKEKNLHQHLSCNPNELLSRQSQETYLQVGDEGEPLPLEGLAALPKALPRVRVLPPVFSGRVEEHLRRCLKPPTEHRSRGNFLTLGYILYNRKRALLIPKLQINVQKY